MCPNAFPCRSMRTADGPDPVLTEPQVRISLVRPDFHYSCTSSTRSNSIEFHCCLLLNWTVFESVLTIDQAWFSRVEANFNRFNLDLLNFHAKKNPSGSLPTIANLQLICKWTDRWCVVGCQPPFRRDRLRGRPARSRPGGICWLTILKPRKAERHTIAK